jgi:hypothetical protein
VPERTQAGILDQVLGVMNIPHQEARQPVRRIEMRQHDAFETGDCALVHCNSSAEGNPPGHWLE